MIIVRCERCDFKESYELWVQRGKELICPRCKKPYTATGGGIKPNVQKKIKPKDIGISDEN